MTGHRRRARRELLAELEPLHARVRAATAARRPVPVFYPIWRGPWMTINADTYVHDLLALCGAANVFADRAERYPTVTLDEMAAHRPEVILLPDEPFRFRRAHLADFAAYPDVPAVRGRAHPSGRRQAVHLARAAAGATRCARCPRSSRSPVPEACPRCGFTDVTGERCPRCGVFVTAFRASLEAMRRGPVPRGRRDPAATPPPQRPRPRHPRGPRPRRALRRWRRPRPRGRPGEPPTHVPRLGRRAGRAGRHQRAADLADARRLLLLGQDAHAAVRARRDRARGRSLRLPRHGRELLVGFARGVGVVLLPVLLLSVLPTVYSAPAAGAALAVDAAVDARSAPDAGGDGGRAALPPQPHVVAWHPLLVPRPRPGLRAALRRGQRAQLR